ncbi:methyl-accepting chemotaxis protein [Clostridium sp. WLY-B-L2]|uniref:Methyl-accepting chemotaxis protein n=1 Tax=Clostridium aromativorans TaxID=2836848 RepID=A0ABS8N8D9_9CLOT|nr:MULTISPECIES: methyl-accepting chemotaxis protein [Clostridium]MCC9296077.1 methyl-accepting chemotaxis protein [Clostridium aromativorans]
MRKVVSKILHIFTRIKERIICYLKKKINIVPKMKIGSTLKKKINAVPKMKMGSAKIISILKKKINCFSKIRINSVVVKVILQIGILVIFICGFFGILSYYTFYAAMEKNINSSLQDKAQESSKLLSSILQQQVRSMTEIASRNEIESMNPGIQLPILQKRASKLGYSSLCAMDLSGMAYMQTGGKTKIDLESVDSAYLKKAIQGTPAIDGPYFNVDGEEIISVAVPIKDSKDKIKGVLFSNISTSELNKFVQSMRVGKSGYCFIINKDGTKVAHKNLTLVLNKDNTIKNSLKDSSLKELSDIEKNMIQGKSGSGYYRQKGEEMLLAYAPISGVNWYLGLVIDKNEIMSSVNALKYRMAAATFIFILAGIFVGIIIARQIKKPLSNIREYAGELSNFNLSYKIDIKSKDEFGQTVVDLNSALKNIKNMIEYAKDEGLAALNSSNYVNHMFQESEWEIKIISDKTSEITSNMQGVMNSIKEVEESIFSIKNKIENTVNEANSGLNLADNINKKAVSMGDDIENSAHNIEKYYEDSSEKLKESFETIKVVKNISKMLNEMKDVSKKTNILALNALIEASHAGKYGSGFMVVAKEVKKLANKCSDMADNMQNDIKSIIMAVGILVDSSRDVLGFVEKKVMTDYIKVVDISKEYQNDGIKMTGVIKKFYGLMEDINRSQQDLSNIIEKIGASVDKCTDAVSNISSSMNSIKEKDADIALNTDKNAKEAEKLMNIVGQFKI